MIDISPSYNVNTINFCNKQVHVYTKYGCTVNSHGAYSVWYMYDTNTLSSIKALRGTKPYATLPSPRHSKLGCLLFPAGSSCNAMVYHCLEGVGGEKLLFFIITQQSFKKVLQGKVFQLTLLKKLSGFHFRPTVHMYNIVIIL